MSGRSTERRRGRGAEPGVHRRGLVAPGREVLDVEQRARDVGEVRRP